VDAAGRFLVPGLIDPHIHPEVTKLTMTRVAEALLAHGTTSIMCSLDQIGVVAGIEGIRFALDEFSRTPLKVFYNAPSRLPYTTPASTVAHTFGLQEHRRALEWDETVGMWEYMIESIAGFEEGVLDASSMLLDGGRRPQGHLPFTSGPLLSAAVAAGATSDHESWFANEVAEKLRAGLYVFLRKASCVDNVAEGLRAVTDTGLPTRRLSFCADDIDCSDIVDLGHMDACVRYAVGHGIAPLQAIQMATLTPAEAFRVDHLVGSLAPGRIGDVLLVDDLGTMAIHSVFADGRPVFAGGRLLVALQAPTYPARFFDTMRLDRLVTEDDVYLRVPDSAAEADVLVMQLESSQIRSRRNATLPVRAGRIQPAPDQDVLYISVTDRHSGKGQMASAFVGGFGLKRGAFATSLSPDDDNVICVGASVPDMVVAIRHLFQVGGGQVVADEGRVVDVLELPVCGIMADVSVQAMAERERALARHLSGMGVTIPKPLFSVLFLSITAIPQFAITDQGLVEAARRQVVSPILSWR